MGRNYLGRTADAVSGAFNFLVNLDYNPAHWYDKGKRTVQETVVEIPVLAAVGMLAAGTWAYTHELKKSHQIPLGFSEMRQIEKDAAAAGRDVGPFTHYLTTVNDSNMKVFECWNQANDLTGNRETFAKELEYRIDRSMKIYRYNLVDLLEQVPERARSARSSFKDFSSAKMRMDLANEELDNAWDESHVDHYRTETYTDTETYTGSDGKSHTRTVTKTRQV